MLANLTSRKGFLIGQRSDIAKRPCSLNLWLGSMPSLGLYLFEVLILEKLATTCSIICNIIMLHSVENLVHQGKTPVLRRE